MRCPGEGKRRKAENTGGPGEGEGRGYPLLVKGFDCRKSWDLDDRPEGRRIVFSHIVASIFSADFVLPDLVSVRQQRHHQEEMENFYLYCWGAPCGFSPTGRFPTGEVSPRGFPPPLPGGTPGVGGAAEGAPTVQVEVFRR